MIECKINIALWLVNDMYMSMEMHTKHKMQTNNPAKRTLIQSIYYKKEAYKHVCLILSLHTFAKA